MNAQVAERVDPRIKYPSYKSFDEFIDVEWLKSLDAYVTERIECRVAQQKDIAFYTGPFRLAEKAPDKPGSKMVYLSQPKGEDNYYDLDNPAAWEPAEGATEFSELMEFIATLPFKATARMLIMYDPEGRAVTAHRDHVSYDLCHEFVWFRTNLRKPFYMLNENTGEKQYVESHSAWFDSVNQFHGGDATGELAISIRVDGIFSDDFRAQIPVPGYNRASMPSLWTCTCE
ncbi:MAG: hypothetical protein H0U43_00555 [Chthoniobacterales bacterium]|nr:hypothetical protein [Chthoniobacterales bacterium]